MTMADICITGGGIFGLSVAWAAARRGARVCVMEARRIGDGASGGLVGALAPHAPEGWTPAKAFQRDSLLMAGSWWREVARAGDQDPGYLRSGRLQPLGDANALERAHARAAAAAALWQGEAEWRIVPAGRWPGWEPASATGWLVHDTLSARIAPRAALAALAAAITARGGTILENTGPDAPAPPARARVLATGWEGLARLRDGTGRTAGGAVKGQAACLACDRPPLPQIYAEGLHIVPHGNGTVAVGSTTEREFTDATGTDAGLEAVIARARMLCPALARAPVVDRWAGLRPRARSRLPLAGPLPDRPGWFLANGGFKTGFGVAPLLAEALVDLILEGHDRLPDAFRPEAPGAG